jgi:chromosome segregation protein
VQGYRDFVIEERDVNLDTNTLEAREKQIERKRELEKMKIRLEEIGGASADEITKEHAEVKARDDFLGDELEDLEKSTELLHKLIEDLDNELTEKFKTGLEEISTQFNEFFVMMFGGGSAKLTMVEEKIRKRKENDDLLSIDTEDEDEEETTVGVEVEVSLPKKRIQSLMMLSGGERALTSIALIFAMSQVNPPPFLILDETDAALDEANSKRYGDMIENLSQKSQLILITHNRETMSRAAILYGVTMGADGISRILSVKFDDAVAVAK